MNKQAPKLEKSGVNRLKEMLFWMIVMPALFFLSAGRLDWWPAWAYIGLNIAFFIGDFG